MRRLSPCRAASAPEGGKEGCVMGLIVSVGGSGADQRRLGEKADEQHHRNRREDQRQPLVLLLLFRRHHARPRGRRRADSRRPRAPSGGRSEATWAPTFLANDLG